VVAVLLIAGDQLPKILLFEVVGSVIVPPLHIGLIWVKVGLIALLMATVNDPLFAHWPALGMNVYVVVAVILTAGLHVPLNPSLDIEGNVNEPLEH
jgi:hypothetical protein